MKVHNGGLGNFLNEVTQAADKGNFNSQDAGQIVYVDIDDIESNPQNFYGLRDIDELAGLIAVSHLIEPLTVSKKPDGKYMLISGHRRRAAVQKLLEDGVYDNRQLPCIVKAREKITIEQENGEIVEFDEDAVDMLNLIVSNRGQREERTTDEKLQEVKYLESFARAIYNQKNRGSRGRFRTFFAEEILNISKSQLQRINSMENLTTNVKRAIDEKKVSETAAIEMASMTSDEQDACLDKILTGEIKGTVQDIQKYKSSKAGADEESSGVDVVTESSAETAEAPTDLASENVEETPTASPDDIGDNSDKKLSYPKSLLPKDTSDTSEPVSKKEVKIIDVPEHFDDPQKEANEWFYQERIRFYEMMYAEAKRLSTEEPDELKAAQWGIRASVARYNIEELKINHGVK